MDRGEGQHWNIAPGNLYSVPKKISLGSSRSVAIVLDQEIPPITPPQDTKYIRHLKIQSELLTKFWGRPMFLSANVLLPEGFDTHPEAHFPLMISEDHFNADFEGFSTEPPDPSLKPDYSDRFHLSGYDRIQQDTWAVIERSGDDDPLAARITKVETVSHAAYNITATVAKPRSR